MTNNHPDHVHMKVKWQVIAAVDRNNQCQLFLVGRCEPDIAKNARSRHIHMSMREHFPELWAN